jgi:hypothetical protein
MSYGGRVLVTGKAVGINGKNPALQNLQQMAANLIGAVECQNFFKPSGYVPM